MALRMILGAVIGGGIGLTIGLISRCSTGSCPLIGNPYGGTLFGALLGLIIASGGLGGRTRVAESASSLLTLDSDNFKAEVRESDKPVLVDFYADWCGPCRTMEPIVEALASRYSPEIKFARVNVDTSPGLARQYGISSIPTFVFFRAGTEQDRLVGAVRKEALEKRIKALLGATTGADRPAQSL